MSSVLPWKRGFIWAEKSVFYCKKGVHFGLKSQSFIAKKGSFWAEKSVFCCKKGGHFQTREQGWVPLFPVSEGAGSWPRNSNMQGINVCTASTIISFALWMAVAQRHVYCGNGKQRGTLTCASSLLPCILCQWSCNVIYTMTNIHAKYMYVLSNVDVCHIIYDMQTTMHSLI